MTTSNAELTAETRPLFRLRAFLLRLAVGDDRPSDVTGSPHRDIEKGLWVLGLFLLAFVGWGLVAHLDAGVYAPGTIVVFGNRQSIQHRDGGIVSELDIHEGDHVKAGQVLLKLSPDELQADERATADQVFEYEALQARLMAEATGQRSLTPPADFETLTGQDRVSAENAMDIEQREFSARAADLSAQKSVLGQREGQLGEEIQGYRRQVEANQSQQALIGQEMDGLQDLLKRGLVPMTRMRSLQRDQAALAGNYGEYNADIAKTREQIGETQFQSSDLDRQRIAEVSKDYRDAEMQLSSARPKLAALREQIARATVRAPVGGQVVGLTIFTPGGVVGPGQRLMDIVPDDQPLVIEARIKPDDAGDIKVGQSTEIRIPAFRDRRMPLLTGTVTRVSADSLIDDKTGVAYYEAEVTVPSSEQQVISDLRGAGLKAGLPVEVVVPLHSRTALGYLLDPLRNMLWRSFRDR